MRRVFYIIILVLTAQVSLSAQQQQQQCPSIRAQGPEEVTTSGIPLTFTVMVEGLKPAANVEFHWTVSVGTILGGQGTQTITVDTLGLNATELTATVEVKGLEARCFSTSNYTAQIAPVCIFTRKFDEYGDIEVEAEMARLDNLSIEIQTQPDARAYLLGYGGRRARRGEAAARLERARDYLVKTRGLAPSRVITLDGGHREEMTIELFIVPAGVEPPATSPTVAPEEVEYINDKPKPNDPRGRNKNKS